MPRLAKPDERAHPVPRRSNSLKWRVSNAWPWRVAGGAIGEAQSSGAIARFVRRITPGTGRTLWRSRRPLFHLRLPGCAMLSRIRSQRCRRPVAGRELDPVGRRPDQAREVQLRGIPLVAGSQRWADSLWSPTASAALSPRRRRSVPAVAQGGGARAGGAWTHRDAGRSLSLQCKSFRDAAHLATDHRVSGHGDSVRCSIQFRYLDERTPDASFPLAADLAQPPAPRERTPLDPAPDRGDAVLRCPAAAGGVSGGSAGIISCCQLGESAQAAEA